MRKYSTQVCQYGKVLFSSTLKSGEKWLDPIIMVDSRHCKKQIRLSERTWIVKTKQEILLWDYKYQHLLTIFYSQWSIVQFRNGLNAGVEYLLFPKSNTYCKNYTKFVTSILHFWSINFSKCDWLAGFATLRPALSLCVTYSVQRQKLPFHYDSYHFLLLSSQSAIVFSKDHFMIIIC